MRKFNFYVNFLYLFIYYYKVIFISRTKVLIENIKFFNLFKINTFIKVRKIIDYFNI